MARIGLAGVLCAVGLAACGGGELAPADAGARDSAPSDAPADGSAGSGCWRMPEGDRAPAFRGPSAPVEVLRDSLGIPHIYGATDEDVMFAAGYMQAVDRLFQMDLMRRSARGTLAAVIGREKLQQDELVRLMEVPRYGVESGERVRRESPALAGLLDAWVAGVNRRVAEVRSGAVPRPAGFRPSEFDYAPEPWTVDDPHMISWLIFFRNANQLEYDVLSTLISGLFPEVAADLPFTRSFSDAFIVPPDERPTGTRMTRRAPRPRRARPASAPAPTVRHRAVPPGLMASVDRFLGAMAPFARGASNNWAVAGRHSANGRPLLAGDPHQSLQSPSVFWAHHMNSAARGGTLDVVGFGFAGSPGIQLGHNRRVGWTATTAYPDTMDLWRAPYDGNAITLGGRAYPVARCTETVAVRGEQAVEYPVERVPGRGVIIPNGFTPVPITSGPERLLFNWSGFRATSDAAMFFGFDRAQSVDEFDALVRSSEVSSFNFVAADARGIAYRSTVLLPRRNAGVAANAALDGSDPRTLWGDGFVPADTLPHSRGGARGFLVSANNDPFGFTADGRTDDDPFYYGAWFDPGTRAARIERELARLTARGGVTAEDMQALQLDTRNLLADDVLPSLFEAWQRAGNDPSLAAYRADARLAALHDALTAWDRRMARDSSAAVIYEGYQHFLARAVLRDDAELLFDAVISREPIYILKILALTLNRRFPRADRYMQGGRDALALRALADTRDWLAARFGDSAPSRYRWSDFHRTRVLPSFERAGVFDAGSTPTDGAIGTVNVSQAQFFDGANVRMYHESKAGAAYRMVISFAEDGTPTAVVNFPRGNSGDPSSPFWGNTHEDWAAGRYRAIPFARAAVEADVRERTTVMP